MKFVLPIIVFVFFLKVHVVIARVKQQRIVGGKSTSTEKYPFVVRLIILNKRGAFLRNRCGGSIIRENWIVTACHCLDRFTRMYIDKGQALIRGNASNTDSEDSNDHRIIYYYMHEKFNILELNLYDIALIKVKEPFNAINERSITIAPSNYEYKAGTTAYLLGWGYTDKAVTKQSSVLRVTNGDLMSDSDCMGVYSLYNLKGGFAFRALVDDVTFCAWTFSKSYCEGDNGGPMIQNHLLIGIISVRLECGSEHFPAMYTKAPILKDWIQNITKQY